MSSELALHAYIFLGNALNLLTQDRPQEARAVSSEGAADISAGELAALYVAVEPLSPATILTGITELSTRERELLGRCGRLWLSRPQAEFEVMLGLRPDEARQVLDWLDAQGG